MIIQTHSMASHFYPSNPIGKYSCICSKVLFHWMAGYFTYGFKQKQQVIFNPITVVGNHSQIPCAVQCANIVEFHIMYMIFIIFHDGLKVFKKWFLRKFFSWNMLYWEQLKIRKFCSKKVKRQFIELQWSLSTDLAIINYSYNQSQHIKFVQKLSKVKLYESFKF